MPRLVGQEPAQVSPTTTAVGGYNVWQSPLLLALLLCSCASLEADGATREGGSRA